MKHALTHLLPSHFRFVILLEPYANTYYEFVDITSMLM